MSQEEYKPTESEIKEAEGTMTDKQKELSKKRESGEIENLYVEYEEIKKECGVKEGDIDWIGTEPTYPNGYASKPVQQVRAYSGVINGHKFRVEDTYQSGIFSGRVDEKYIPDDLATSIFYKFYKLAKAKLKIEIGHESEVFGANYEIGQFHEKTDEYKEEEKQKLKTIKKDLLGK